MRYWLSFALLLPLAAQAQLFNRFEAGSYVLADNPTLRLSGQLKLRGNSHLLVQDEAGNTQKLAPAQVSWFRLGSQKYTVTTDFHVKDGLDVNQPVFVEQVDSGQVVLLRYTYQVGGRGMGTSGPYSIYLLRWSTETMPTPVQASFYSSGGKQFREAVRPFLVGRPELVKLLDEKRIGEPDIPALVKALNTDSPFNPPPLPAPPSLSD